MAYRPFHPRLILIALSLFFAIFFILSQKGTFCTRLRCLSMKNLQEFTVQEIYQDDGGIYRALLARDDDLLRVDVRSGISRAEAEQSIQAQITRMKALFESAVSPYPGEISDEIVCGEEFIPVFEQSEINSIHISRFTGYLNDRLVIGACTKDQAFYKGVLVLFYCPDQAQLFQLELIAPKEDFLASEDKYQDMLVSIRCR